MALLRDFEVPGTGLVAPNAYHVINNVKTEKRMADIELPPDESREDGLTDGGRGDEVYWKKGYIGYISVLVYVSKEARDNGNQAIGHFGEFPTEGAPNGLFTDGTAFQLMFRIDPDSSDSILTQAYNHLLSTDYYSGSEQV